MTEPRRREEARKNVMKRDETTEATKTDKIWSNEEYDRPGGGYRGLRNQWVTVHVHTPGGVVQGLQVQGMFLTRLKNAMWRVFVNILANSVIARRQSRYMHCVVEEFFDYEKHIQQVHLKVE